MTCRGKNRRSCALLSLLFCLSLTGCQEQEVVNKEVEIQNNTSQAITYELTPVMRGPVQQVMFIQCTYTQTQEVEVSFDIDQEVITEVLVEKGDSVKKGEVLASVNVESTEQKAEQLRYQIAVDELALKQLIEKRDFELEQTKIWYEGYTLMTDEDKKSMKEEQEKLKESYGKRIQNAEDTLYIERKRLQEYEEYIHSGQLRAPMSGVMSFVRSNLEGALTEKETTIMRIYDPESKMYYSKNVEAIPYLQEDKEYTIVCGLGNRQREYTVVPARREEWGEEIYFRLLDEDYDPNNVVLGKITLIIDEKEEALYLNDNAVHSSQDKYYVYTLDENNVRRMQFVEVGLWGDGIVEIVSGLSEGDRVILK